MSTSATSFRAFFESYAASHRSKHKAFERFFNLFGVEYDSARASRASMTPHLDVLKVFGLGHREIPHSKALSWFLRADAEHEQSTLFTDALLRLVKLPNVSNPDYHVLLERPDRVDVAVYADEEFAVFIESKINAKERPKQFQDLMSSLKTFSVAKGIPSGRRVAIFLTSDGRASDTIPPTIDKTLTVFNLRRNDIFKAFSDSLFPVHLKRKSILLEQFLRAYESSLPH